MAEMKRDADRSAGRSALLPDAALRGDAYVRLVALLERHWDEVARRRQVAKGSTSASGSSTSRRRWR
jgi:hypothetical protein